MARKTLDDTLPTRIEAAGLPYDTGMASTLAVSIATRGPKAIVVATVWDYSLDTYSDRVWFGYWDISEVSAVLKRVRKVRGVKYVQVVHENLTTG